MTYNLKSVKTNLFVMDSTIADWFGHAHRTRNALGETDTALRGVQRHSYFRIFFSWIYFGLECVVLIIFIAKVCDWNDNGQKRKGVNNWTYTSTSLSRDRTRNELYRCGPIELLGLICSSSRSFVIRTRSTLAIIWNFQCFSDLSFGMHRNHCISSHKAGKIKIVHQSQSLKQVLSRLGFWSPAMQESECVCGLWF